MSQRRSERRLSSGRHVSPPGHVHLAGLCSVRGSGAAALASGNQVFINLTGVANAQRITLTLVGMNDGTSRADIPVSMGVLLGDVNASGQVDSGDVLLVQKQNGQALPP